MINFHRLIIKFQSTGSPITFENDSLRCDVITFRRITFTKCLHRRGNELNAQLTNEMGRKRRKEKTVNVWIVKKEGEERGRLNEN